MTLFRQPRTFLSLPELLEIDRTLLDERVPALHRLLGAVVETERGARELGHAGPRLGVDVEGLLGQRERGRALLEKLRAPALHLRAQILEGHDPVDQAHLERLVRRVLPAEIPDLARLL